MISFWQVSHFIQIWIFPPGSVLLLMLCSFILMLRWPRTGKFLLFFTFVSFWLLSTPFVVQKLIDRLQNQYRPISIENTIFTKENSAIVVLGSGVENAREYANKSQVSEKTLSRLDYAVYLQRASKLPIIVSGGNKTNTANTEAEVMQAELINHFHVPVKAIEVKSTNTEEESFFLLPILQQYEIKKIYLVTHAWHMPRSMYLFKRTLAPFHIEVVAAPMGYLLLKSDEGFSNYLPLINGLNTCVFAMHEYIGTLAAFFWRAQRPTSLIR